MSRPLLLAIAAALPLLLYSRTATFGFVGADDLDLIAANQSFLSDLRNVPRAFARSYFEVEGELTDEKTYYRPLAVISFMLDAARGGADPTAYHVTNVVLHAAVTCVLLQLAITWGALPLVALCAALLFALHPMNTQAVAWIAGRNDLLLALFGLSSMLSFAALKRRATPEGGRATPEDGARRSRAPMRQATSEHVARRFGAPILHVVTFALTLFSKETGLFFPALAALHQTVVAGAPLARLQNTVLVVDALLVGVWAILRGQALAGMPSEMNVTTIRTALVNSPQLLVHAGKMLLPVRLNVAPGVYGPDLAVGCVAVAIAAWVAWTRVPRGLTVFGLAWALAFLLPTLAVPGLPVYEHRAYVPLIGIAIVIALFAGGARLVPDGRRIPHIRLKPEATNRPASVASGFSGKTGTGAGFSRAVVGVVLATFAALTLQRQAVFRDAVAYWTDATQDPQFGTIAHVNLGQLHEREGRLEEARREYLRALQRNPDTPKAHNNLGVVLMHLDQPELALSHFREETRRHPRNADAWFNLGLFEETRGNTIAAHRHYERAIAENHAYAPAYEKLGLTPPRRR